MKIGTLYGIGIGPGDPELITLKAQRILSACRHVFVPKSGTADESVALDIARQSLRSDAEIHTLVFPMNSDRDALRASWRKAADSVRLALLSGEDCCFLTLGDALLYSTYIYLLRELRAVCPEANVVTVPGVTAFSAAAAMTNFPVGEGKESVTIVPLSDDMAPLRAALDAGGTVVLMKIGARLEKVLGELAARGLLDRGVFVSHAGMANQRVELDLRRLRNAEETAGYLSVIIVRAT